MRRACPCVAVALVAVASPDVAGAFQSRGSNLVGIVGAIQATETLKVLTGAGRTLAGRLLLIDAMTLEFRTLSLPADPACPVCGC